MHYVIRFPILSDMDWKSIIREILDTGMTQSELASCVGVSQPTICAILNGDQSDVKWSIGENLLRQYKATEKLRVAKTK